MALPGEQEVKPASGEREDPALDPELAHIRRRDLRRAARGESYGSGGADLDAYVLAESVRKGFWANTRQYLVSLLKAWWGDAATTGNEF